MNEELKPCPFCGSDDMNVTVTDIFHAVWCRDCGALVDNDEEDVAKLWNTRPIEDALQARIAELEAENKKQKEWINFLLSIRPEDRIEALKKLSELIYLADKLQRGEG